MSEKLTPEIMALAEERHAMFQNECQRENQAQSNLVKKGHPLAAAYLEARKFFDSLSYASELATRRFSYKGPYESSDFQAPELELSPRPAGEPFRQPLGTIYPGHYEWDEYVETAAKAGWPENAEPQLRPGMWTIRTQNKELRDALAELDIGHNAMYFNGTFDEQNRPYSYKVRVTQAVRYEPGQQGDPLQLHRAICALLRKYHNGYVLPPKV